MSGFLQPIYVLLISIVAVFACHAQNPSASQGSVVLTKLFDPVYPPLARQARITGDVDLALTVGKNGNLESVQVMKGHPLLEQAALDSARRSQFECHECGPSAATYRLTYSFQLIGGDDCCSDASANSKTRSELAPGVAQSESRVTVVDRAVCICDPSADIVRVRSIKCLYLWKCSAR